MSKSWSEEMVYRYQKEIQLLTKERDKLKQELNVSNNALKLACNDIYWLSAFSYKFTKEEFISHKIDYYKKQAEENIKNEVNND